MTCTFFGHRYVQKEIEPMLRSTLIDLIENHDCRLFYVGNHGAFDAMVTRLLRELSDRYPIRAYTALAYLPVGENGASDDLLPTILPEGIETAPLCYLLPKQMDDSAVRLCCDARHKSCRFRRCAVQGARREAGESGHQPRLIKSSLTRKTPTCRQNTTCSS